MFSFSLHLLHTTLHSVRILTFQSLCEIQSNYFFETIATETKLGGHGDSMSFAKISESRQFDAKQPEATNALVAILHIYCFNLSLFSFSKGCANKYGTPK